MTSYDRSKNYFYCVGGRNHSSKIKIKPALSFNKKIRKEKNTFEGGCIKCKRTRTKIVLSKTIEAEGLGSFSKTEGKRTANAPKNFTIKVASNPTTAFEFAAKILTAATTSNA